MPSTISRNTDNPPCAPIVCDPLVTFHLPCHKFCVDPKPKECIDLSEFYVWVYDMKDNITAKYSTLKCPSIPTTRPIVPTESLETIPPTRLSPREAGNTIVYGGHVHQ